MYQVWSGCAGPKAVSAVRWACLLSRSGNIFFKPFLVSGHKTAKTDTWICNSIHYKWFTPKRGVGLSSFCWSWVSNHVFNNNNDHFTYRGERSTLSLITLLTKVKEWKYYHLNVLHVLQNGSSKCNIIVRYHILLFWSLTNTFKIVVRQCGACFRYFVYDWLD